MKFAYLTPISATPDTVYKEIPMDPDITLSDLIDEFNSSEPNREIVISALEDLTEWIKKGGYLPTIKEF